MAYSTITQDGIPMLRRDAPRPAQHNQAYAYAYFNAALVGIATLNHRTEMTEKANILIRYPTTLQYFNIALLIASYLTELLQPLLCSRPSFAKIAPNPSCGRRLDERFIGIAVAFSSLMYRSPSAPSIVVSVIMQTLRRTSFAFLVRALLFKSVLLPFCGFASRGYLMLNFQYSSLPTLVSLRFPYSLLLGVFSTLYTR